jgi:hypothetical protein
MNSFLPNKQAVYLRRQPKHLAQILAIRDGVLGWKNREVKRSFEVSKKCEVKEGKK